MGEREPSMWKNEHEPKKKKITNANEGIDSII